MTQGFTTAQELIDHLGDRIPQYGYHPAWITKDGKIHTGPDHSSILRRLGHVKNGLSSYYDGYADGGIRVVIEPKDNALGLSWDDEGAGTTHPGLNSDVVRTALDLMSAMGASTVRVSGPRHIGYHEVHKAPALKGLLIKQAA